MDTSPDYRPRMLMAALVVSAVMCCGLSSAQHCVSAPTCVNPEPIGYSTVDQDNLQSYLYVAAFIDIHGEGGTPASCGDLDPAGIQQLEAFVWAIRTFQDRHPGMLDGLELGAVAFDACRSSPKVIQTALNADSCSLSWGDPPVDVSRIMGFVGPANSQVALDVAPVTGQLAKNTVSFGATAPELSDVTAYPYFLRTVPDDDSQMEAITQILKDKEWMFVQVVYDDNIPAYRNYFHKLQKLTQEEGICIVNPRTLSAGSSESDLTDLMNTLLDHQDTRVVILLLDTPQIQEVFAAASRADARGKFTWFGTREWGTNEEVTSGSEQIAEGALTLTLGGELPERFTQYLQRLKPDANDYNPWFSEYWQNTFSCNLPGGSNPFAAPCDVDSQVLDTDDLDPHLPYVVQAVDEILMAVHHVRSDMCPGVPTLCSRFYNNVARSAVINEQLHAARGSRSGEVSSATVNPADAVYNIINFKGAHDNCAHHCYAQIGTYSLGDSSIRFTKEHFIYTSTGQRVDAAQQPGSLCSLESCTRCNSNVTSSPLPTGDSLYDVTTVGDGEGTGDAEAPFRKRDGTWVIVLMILAGLGILMVLCFEAYLLYMLISGGLDNQWRTMWLGQILLLGVFLCYLCAFAFVPEPTDTTCGIIRFGVGSTTAMCFSVLLVKLMIILSSEQLGYLKGVFQGLMFLFAWGLQVVIDIEWLILREPQAVRVGEDEWQCKEGFEEHVKSLVYVMLLVVTCTGFSIRTHSIITNYREGVFIGLVAGFTIPVWIVWILMGMLNDDKSYEDPAMAFGLIMTATLVLIIMFFPKVRHLNSMGVEGIYVEDDGGYANSIIPPSIGPAGSMAYGAPPSYRSKGPGSVVLLNGAANGDVLTNYHTQPQYLTLQGTENIHASAGSLPAKNANQAHVVYQGDPDSLYLRHPGSPQMSAAFTTTSPSVRSAPLPPQQLRVDNSNPYATTSRVLRVTNDLSGRLPGDEERRSRSEYNYPLGAEIASARGGNRNYGTQPRLVGYGGGGAPMLKTKSMTDLGAL